MNKYFSVLLSIFIFITLFSFFAQSTYAADSQECKVIVSGLRDLDGDGAFDAITMVPGSSIEATSLPACTSVDIGSLGFQIPTLGDILTFAIRAFFAIAGLAALFYMLLGAFAWVTSGGDKDAITAAREKIQAAVVGMILLVAVLAVIWTLEQVIFKRRICLGLSCSVTLPGLIESAGDIATLSGGTSIMKTEDAFCCVCVKDAGGFGDSINAHFSKCADGVGQPL